MTDSTLWSMKPHTNAKHRILRRYLEAWLPILSQKFHKVIYVDACAGPGIYETGEEGSPVIAAKVYSEHKNLNRKMKFVAVFIEKDQARFQYLVEQIAHVGTVPGMQLKLIPGEFEDCLLRAVHEETGDNPEYTPVFTFIDPFGHHVPLDLVTKFMSVSYREVLISTMVESMIRWHSERPEEMDRLYGTKEWRSCVDLPNAEGYLMSLYRRQLHQVSKIKFTRAFRMRNVQERPIYYLVFGTNGLRGLEKMNEAMWKVDPVAGGDFCDATDPNQLTLFTEPDYERLRRIILGRHVHSEVPCEHVQETVYMAGYCRPHMNHVLTELEAKAQLWVDRPGRSGYPDDCILHFLD